ncbi:MAG: RnfH family protein [Coxiella sp. RIFCSPHIGHO2_12_FULL_42_15]|nr:MAG: RnfH family protein [Coxiella sp. RIFCSPHIGHO2_12_FULL_42_15]
MKVTVAYATPDQQIEIPLVVEVNCTVALAIQRSAILPRFPEIQYPQVSVGIFSKLVSLDARLHAGDRIEIYRPLKIDPKQARRLRAKKS